MWLILILTLPRHEYHVDDVYDGAVWNIVDRRANDFNQLLLFSNTRNGLRYEDFRVMKHEPMKIQHKRYTLLIFVDPRGHYIRRIKVRSYNVITSNYDLELKNRDIHPVGHRRTLTK